MATKKRGFPKLVLEEVLKKPKKASSKTKKPSKAKPSKASKAAKKGWETRRKHRRENVAKVILDKAKKRSTKKVEKFLTGIAHLSKDEQIAILEKKLKENEARMDVLELTSTWVPYHDPEQLHTGRRGNQAYPRGSIALQASRARLLPASGLDAVMRKMRKAYHDGGEYELDDAVNEIAGDLELEVREIYTLWYSP